MKGFIGGILEGILAHMGYATTRERALALELAQVKDELGTTKTRAEAAEARGDAATTVAEERLALLTAAARLAEERAALLTAAAARTDNVQKQLDLDQKERDLTAKKTLRLELRLQAVKRRRERLQAKLAKFQDQLARADVSGRIGELQEENAQLQQRLTDLQTYFTFRTEPPAANRAEEKQGVANQR